MKINGIDIGGGAFSPTQLTDWTTRLAGSHSEGDYAVWTATGAVYQWSASLRSGSGDWVRTEAYTSSYGHEAYLDGDEANEAALQAKGWDSAVEVGNGEITYDGTRIALSGTSPGSGADYSYIVRSTSSGIATSSIMWGCGLYQLTILTNGDYRNHAARLLNFQDGTYVIRIGQSDGFYEYVTRRKTNDYQNYSVQQYGPTGSAQFSSPTDEMHIATHVTPYGGSDTPGVVKLWINHALDPHYLGPRNGVATSNTAQFYIMGYDTGTTRSGVGCVVKVRHFTHGIA